MVGKCYIEGCNSGTYEANEKTHFFKPKDENVLNEWQKLIGRQDLKLNKKHSVCHRHFEDADIIRQKIFEGKDGPIVVYDLCRWRLTDGALPKPSTEKSVKNTLPVLNDEDISVLCEIRNAAQPDYLKPGTNKNTQQHIINPKDIYLPISWFWQEGSFMEKEFICSKFKWLNENKFEYIKTVIISGHSRTIRYFIRGQQVCHGNLKSKFSSLDELSACVNFFDAHHSDDPRWLTNFNIIPAKSICLATVRQDAVLPELEKSASKSLSYPSKKTGVNAEHQSQAKLKLPVRPLYQNISENNGVPKLTNVLKDHTYGVTTDIPIPLVKLPCKTLNHMVLPIAGIAGDDWTTPPMEDRAALTLQYPNDFFSTEVSNSKGLEQRLVKQPSAYECSNYSLISYHMETWCLGIYSPIEFDGVRSIGIVDYKVRPVKVVGKTVAEDDTNLPQPSSLVAQSQQFYRRGKGLSPSKSKQARKPALKEANIENVKPHKEKIHVKLNGRPYVQLAASDLFFEKTNSNESNVRQDLFVGDVSSTSLPLTTEIEKDLDEFEMAKSFLRKEACRKKMLQRKLRRFGAKVSKHKSMARSILKAAKEFEAKRCASHVSKKPKRPSVAKKPGPQTQCNQCGKMILFARMKFHLKVHSGVKSHLCELCGRAFVFRNSLNTHIRFNHLGQDRPKPFMCSTCGHTCRSRNYLEKHERIHSNEKPYHCKYCDKKFREKGTLVRHIRIHTGEKPYTCNACGMSFGARQTYVNHYKRKHEYKEPEKEKLRRPRRSNGPVYSCEFCQRKFHRLLTFENHRTKHTGVTAAIRCRQSNCDFTYSDLVQLKDHMLVKHPEKAYVCSVCKKIFLTKLNLSLHQSVHDPSRGFQCSYCPTRVTAKESLIAHEKLHTRETPHECSFCEMRFHSTYMLQIHMRTHQPGQLKRKRHKKNPVEN